MQLDKVELGRQTDKLTEMAWGYIQHLEDVTPWPREEIVAMVGFALLSIGGSILQSITEVPPDDDPTRECLAAFQGLMEKWGGP